MSENAENLEVIKGDPIQEVADDLAYKRLGIVNVLFYGRPDEPWVLVDAGLPGTAHSIRAAARERFGDRSPEAIVLTHGHFDHVGALKSLADEWDVPVYAHGLEHPYLDGRSSYPPPDPAAGGGLMARTSFIYPKGPIDVGSRLRPLPEDGSVPGMPGWRSLHTPGHTPGHVSLWRGADRLLVAGDAFVTTRAESVYAVAVQKPEVHGPPRYYTPDWGAAEASVQELAALEPETVVSGHGPALRGAEMRRNLHRLADDFQTLAVPDKGRYVDLPARADESGTTYVPEGGGGAPVPVLAAAGALLVAAGGYALFHEARKNKRSGREGQSPTGHDAPTVERSLTVGKGADELYDLWLYPGTVAQVMGHFAELTEAAGDTTRWQVRLPLGRELAYSTEIFDKQPGKLVRWASSGDSPPATGSVRFRSAPGARGTVVTLRLEFTPPGGALGKTAAETFKSVPETVVGKALRRFKSLAETGEIPTLERNPSARGRGDRL